MIGPCAPREAMRRINTEVAHIWMVRTFLKHHELFEDDAERMEIPRALFDFVRAIETAAADGDAERYLKLVRKKLAKLRTAAEELANDESAVASHTNVQQASASLTGSVTQIEEILTAVDAHQR